MDVGAGYGTFCQAMIEKKHFNNVYALEPNKSGAEQRQKNLRDELANCTQVPNLTIKGGYQSLFDFEAFSVGTVFSTTQSILDGFGQTKYQWKQ